MSEWCPCCHRTMEKIGHGWMVGEDICKDCFIEWYDGDRPTAGKDGHNAYLIGSWIRKKHNLPRLSEVKWTSNRESVGNHGP